MPEYPHFVQFMVQSKRRVVDSKGHVHHYLVEGSPQVDYRTWGS